MATYSKGANGAFPGKVGSGPQLAQHRLPESSAKRLDKLNVASSNGITTYDTASSFLQKILGRTMCFNILLFEKQIIATINCQSRYHFKSSTRC